MNIKWDANKYTEDFSFVHQYGNSVIELIDADKGSSVLDLGCGNGALTKVLQKKGYCVKGLDQNEGCPFIKSCFTKDCIDRANEMGDDISETPSS